MLPDAVLTIFVMIREVRRKKSDPCQKSDDHSRLLLFRPILRSKVPSAMIIRVTIVETNCVYSVITFRNDRKKGLESH